MDQQSPPASLLGGIRWRTSMFAAEFDSNQAALYEVSDAAFAYS
jgi:hypothetical protein